MECFWLCWVILGYKCNLLNYIEINLKSREGVINKTLLLWIHPYQGILRVQSLLWSQKVHIFRRRSNQLNSSCNIYWFQISFSNKRSISIVYLLKCPQRTRANLRWFHWQSILLFERPRQRAVCVCVCEEGGASWLHNVGARRCQQLNVSSVVFVWYVECGISVCNGCNSSWCCLDSPTCAFQEQWFESLWPPSGVFSMTMHKEGGWGLWYYSILSFCKLLMSSLKFNFMNEQWDKSSVCDYGWFGEKNASRQ